MRNVNENRLHNAIAYHNENGSYSAGQWGGKSRDCKNFKRHFPTRGAFQISRHLISKGIVVKCRGSVFLRTYLALLPSLCYSLFVPPITCIPMTSKSKHDFLLSLLTPEQMEALRRVQDTLEEDPLYLEHCEKEEKDA